MGRRDFQDKATSTNQIYFNIMKTIILAIFAALSLISTCEARALTYYNTPYNGPAYDRGLAYLLNYYAKTYEKKYGPIKFDAPLLAEESLYPEEPEYESIDYLGARVDTITTE